MTKDIQTTERRAYKRSSVSPLLEANEKLETAFKRIIIEEPESVSRVLKPADWIAELRAAKSASIHK